ncbi:MAG: Wzz/FepE/Etk N-terminal domain-containing protein [Pseudomonadota bacterium]
MVLDLRAVIGVLWRGKLLIVAVTALVTILAVAYVLLAASVYRATTLLSPVNQDQAGGLAGLAAEYAGLASLAGINLGSSGGDKTAYALQVLQSRAFISAFISKRDLSVPLMAARRWDAGSDGLVLDEDVYDEAAQKWVRKARPPRTAEPSEQEKYEAFIDILSVAEDTQTGFVFVSIAHYSPSVARDWLHWLVADLNEEIRRQDVEMAEQAIAYLEQQIELTSLAEMREVFFRLIEEQTKTVLLANANREYVLRTIDPPFAPERRWRPQRKLVVLLSFFAGGLLGCLIVLFRVDAQLTGREPESQ